MAYGIAVACQVAGMAEASAEAMVAQVVEKVSVEMAGGTEEVRAETAVAT